MREPAQGQTPGTYYDRIHKLSERLSGLQTGLEAERNSRFDQLNLRMHDIDTRLATQQEGAAKKFSLLKEQLSQFQKDLEEEKIGRDRVTDGKNKELLNIDLKLQAALEAEQQARRESEVRILNTFDQKTAELRDEVAKEGNTRLANESKLRKYLEDDIPKLHDGLREEIQQREQMEARIVKRANDEIQRLQDCIVAEKKAREDTEEAMLRMMEDVVAKIQAEIAQERQDREATEETLLRLLEETCTRLNMASQTL